MSLVEKLEKKDIKSFNLDSLVYDASEKMATKVNNQGLEKQIDFIKKAGFTEKDILSELDIK